MLSLSSFCYFTLALSVTLSHSFLKNSFTVAELAVPNPSSMRLTVHPSSRLPPAHASLTVAVLRDLFGNPRDVSVPKSPQTSPAAEAPIGPLRASIATPGASQERLQAMTAKIAELMKSMTAIS